MRTDKLDVIFPSELSRAENCFCDACHGTGRVVKLKIPETLFFDGNGLSTKYRNYWLCDTCRTMLAHALNCPMPEGGEEMSYFDALIRAGLDTDAIRFLSQEYYDNGKMGHTRKLLLERVAEKLDKAEAEAGRLTDLLDHYNAKCAICDCSDDVTVLQAENAKLRKVVDAARVDRGRCNECCHHGRHCNLYKVCEALEVLDKEGGE